MSIYKNFERIIKEKNLTPYRIAKATGITTATMTSWKQGKYTPKMDKLQKIADYLGIDVLDLYSDKFSDYESQEDLEKLDLGETPVLRPLPTTEFSISALEKKIILAFRNLSEDNKDFIINALGIKRESGTEMEENINVG